MVSASSSSLQQIVFPEQERALNINDLVNLRNMGILKAFKKALQTAMKDPKFMKVFLPTAVNGGGSRAFENVDIRVDHGEPGTGNRVVQIQSQTPNPTLKKFMQEHGTHTKVAVVQVDEAGPNDTAKFYDDAVDQAGQF